MWVLTVISQQGWFENEEPLRFSSIGVFKERADFRFSKCVEDLVSDLVSEGCLNIETFSENTPSELKTTLKWYLNGDWKRVEIRLTETADFTDWELE